MCFWFMFIHGLLGSFFLFLSLILLWFSVDMHQHMSIDGHPRIIHIQLIKCDYPMVSQLLQLFKFYESVPYYLLHANHLVHCQPGQLLQSSICTDSNCAIIAYR